MTYLFFLLVFLSSAQAKFCREWGAPVKVGLLDTNTISESSGMIISHNFGDRLYHINDSGDGAYFYFSKMDGSATNKIEISNFRPKDVEDMSYGQCGNEKCIFIGDIGDNSNSRKFIKIIAIEELEKFPVPTRPRFSQELSYPDGPHNCEAMAIHPSGDLFFITKINSPNELARIYKLPSSKVADESTKLEFIGNLNIKSLIKNNFSSLRITGMTISPDGEKFAVLTYDFAVEFKVNLGALKDWNSVLLKEGENYNLIKLKVLPQQEAITYSKDGLKLYYSTEKNLGYFESPIMEISCKN